MVFTPLHYVQAYLLNKVFKGKLNAVGLLIGSMLPYIENPILLMLGYHIPYDRLVLHSIFGSIAFSWILGMILLQPYKAIVKLLTNVSIGNYSLPGYVFAVEVGSITHILIDSLHHEYNPLLWPFTYENVKLLAPIDPTAATIILHILFSIALMVIIYYEYMRTFGKVGSLKYFIAKLLLLNNH